MLTKYSHFDTPTVDSWLAGARRDIKANSAEIKLDLGKRHSIILLLVKHNFKFYVILAISVTLDHLQGKITFN
jgi:hypothetical protein